MAKTFLVVGAGITGATIAERLSNAGHEVVVIDRRNHIAGNCFDSVHPNTDVLVHKYGPHIFHTNSGRIWAYVNEFSAFRPYRHRVLGHITGKGSFQIPANLNTFHALFGKDDSKRYTDALLKYYVSGAQFNLSDLKSLQTEFVQDTVISEFRSRIFHALYDGYLKKHWGAYADQIDESVLNRVPIRLSTDDVFFTDKYQGVPVGGYTAMIAKMLSHKNVMTITGLPHEAFVKYRDFKTIWSGCIDEYFKYSLGRLPYRSLEFRSVVNRSPDKIMQCGQYVFNDASVPITRTVEHRWLTGQDSLYTVRTSEWPCAYEPGKNEPFYPIPCPESKMMYERYADLAKTVKDKVLFAGRLGRYQYFSMAQAVGNALSLFESEAEFFNT